MTDEMSGMSGMSGDIGIGGGAPPCPAAGGFASHANFA